VTSKVKGHMIRLRVVDPLVENESPRNTKTGRKVAHAMENNAIIDSPCVRQFYLLVMGNQTAMEMKFAVRVNGRMRSIEFSIKITVRKKLRIETEMQKDN